MAQLILIRSSVDLEVIFENKEISVLFHEDLIHIPKLIIALLKRPRPAFFQVKLDLI